MSVFGGKERFDKRAVKFFSLLFAGGSECAAAFSIAANKSSLFIVFSKKSVAPAAAARAIEVGLSNAVNAITLPFGHVSRSGLMNEMPSSPC